MTDRFREFESGWCWARDLADDLVIELEWCHGRRVWLKGIGPIDGPRHSPIPVDLPAPQGADDEALRHDAERIAIDHLDAVVPR